MNRIITISLTLRTGKVWTILLYLTVGIMPQGRGETWEWQFRTEHCTKETQKIWSLWGDWVKEVCLALKRSERQLHLPEILRDWWKSYFKSVVPTVSSYLLQLENKTWEKKFKYKQWSFPPRQTVWEALKNPPHNIVLLKPIENS